MAEQEPHSLASAWPLPPPFWKDFTPDKTSQMEELRKTYIESLLPGDLIDPAITTRIPDVPEHLTQLQPPAEPEDGRWRVFGAVYELDHKLPTMEEQDILNLPATHPSRANAPPPPPSDTDAAKETPYTDRALELKRLVKSLLLNFLELTSVLASDPSHAETKIDDIRTLLINIHHALNEYRPHQARESAAELMQEHLDRTQRETVAIRSQVDKAKWVLEGLGSLTVPPKQPEGGGGVKEDNENWEEVRKDREMELWKTIDAAFT